MKATLRPQAPTRTIALAPEPGEIQPLFSFDNETVERLEDRTIMLVMRRLC
jgi:hypothetical protein